MEFKIQCFNIIFIYLNRTALHIAVIKQNIEIINLLLSRKGINTDVKDEIILKNKLITF